VTIAPDLVPAGSRLDRSLDPAEQIEWLTRAAKRLRRRNLELVAAAGLGHIGGDLSATDILATLYFAVLNVDPSDPRAPDRDRFVLSKGHCSGALYTTLAAAGFIAPELLDSYMQPLSPLNGHPDAKSVPGVEANTGPLGHGLPIAVGMAIAARLDRSPRRVFCLVGDGELQEGSNWEALMCAGHRCLDNLTVIVDRNGLQQGSRTEETTRLDPLDARAAAFGWRVQIVDGHDYRALLDLFEALPTEPRHPTFVIANTIKGRGVSFMEDNVAWHHRVPTERELADALAELSG
jgi:transketolase